MKYYISSNKYTIQERKTKKNGILYDVVFRIIEDGTVHQKKLSGFKTKKLAHQAYTDFVTTYCELKPRNYQTDVKRESPLVTDMIRSYLSSLDNTIKDSSVYDKRNLFQLFITPECEGIRADGLTKQFLLSWQDNLWSAKNKKGSYYSYSYLDKIRSYFSAFMSWASERYNIINHFEDIKKPKRITAKQEMEIWTVEEFNKFISVVEDPLYRCLYTMMFFTGRRKGEIFALTPEDVKQNKISWNKSLTRKTTDGSAYKITSTKENKSDIIPICRRLQNELKGYPGSEPFFFGGEKPLAENTVTRQFNRYCKLAEVKQIKIHSLRHSFVSMCIHEGANLAVVASLISDTLEQVTKTYGHLYISDRDDVISRLG